MSVIDMKSEAHAVADLNKLYKKGLYRKAYFQGQKALRRWPNSIGLHHLTGLSAQCLPAQNMAAKKHLIKASSLEDKPGNATYDLGLLLLAAGDFQGAERAFRARLEMVPDNARCVDALARALSMQGDYKTAINLHIRAGKLDPSNPKFILHLGATLEAIGLSREGINAFKLARKLGPNSVDALLGLARCYRKEGLIEEALTALHGADLKFPDRVCDICMAQGETYLAAGQFDAGRAAFEAVLKRDPGHAMALFDYINNFGGGNGPVEKMLRTRVEDKHTPPEEMDLIYFALAKIEKDAGRFEASHAAYRTANVARRSLIGTSLDNDRRQFQAIKDQYENLPPRKPSDVTANGTKSAPIFIVGMPRSGTTLVESILARHHDVTPLGECETLTKIITQNLIETEAPAVFAKAYLDATASAVSSQWFTDKNPLNFRFLGQIAYAMPGAKIIHMNRDPRASAWSIYTKRLVVPTYGFSYDPEDLIAYFDLYRDMMTFWEKRLPGKVINVNYEDLTAQPDVEIPTLLAALNLSWDAACLSPEQGTHAVNTASKMQVRKPIYQGSSEAWRAYEPYAGNWLNRLVS